MLRGLLFLISAAAAALGLLTVVKAPEWVPWQTAVLAGEYGYWVAILPAGILVITLFLAGMSAVLIRLLALAAVGLLVQPCFQAWRIGRRLPARLEQAFGRPEDFQPGVPFSWDRLFADGPAAAAYRTYPYAPYDPGLALDFYPAKGRPTGSPAAPCVVVIHGGGWNDGDRGQIRSLNDQLADAGFAVADISYRLAPRAVWPAQRQDVDAALRYLKEHALTLGLDPSRFVLLGRSAGGQIAEAAAYAARDPAIRGVAGLYAPADMEFAYRYGREDDVLKSLSLLRDFLGGTPAAVPGAYESASGYLLARPGLPPTLLVHGELDALVWYRQSSRLAARLGRERVPNLLLTLPWATHAVEYHPQGPAGQLTWFAIRWFVGAVTK